MVHGKAGTVRMSYGDNRVKENAVFSIHPTSGFKNSSLNENKLDRFFDIDRETRMSN